MQEQTVAEIGWIHAKFLTPDPVWSYDIIVMAIAFIKSSNNIVIFV